MKENTGGPPSGADETGFSKNFSFKNITKPNLQNNPFDESIQDPMSVMLPPTINRKPQLQRQGSSLADLMSYVQDQP